MGTYEPYCGDGLGTHRTVGFGRRFFLEDTRLRPVRIGINDFLG